MVIEKRQLLGREKRDINETCHITTAPEMKSRLVAYTCQSTVPWERKERYQRYYLYTCESSSWGEKKRYQRTAPGERKEKFQ